MIVLEFKRCEVNSQISALRHSWLENQVLNRNSETIAKYHERPNDDVRISFENQIKQSGIFEHNLSLVRSLVPIIIDVYSPTQLIEDGPLVDMPESIKVMLKELFHDEYLMNSNIDKLIKPMEEVIQDFENQLMQFRQLWFTSSSNPNSIKECFQLLQSKAKSLYEILQKIPKGIVLP